MSKKELKQLVDFAIEALQLVSKYLSNAVVTIFTRRK